MILVVMRHAHAAPADPYAPGDTGPLVGVGSADHGRPLDARGRLEAREVGGALAARDLLPDLVLCSDARRARETWERMEGAFGRPVPALYMPGFYTRGAASALDALADVQAGLVYVIGHNPEWENLVARLSGALVPMSPATAVALELVAPSWRQGVAQWGRWRCRDVVRAL